MQVKYGKTLHSNTYHHRHCKIHLFIYTEEEDTCRRCKTIEFNTQHNKLILFFARHQQTAPESEQKGNAKIIFVCAKTKNEIEEIYTSFKEEKLFLLFIFFKRVFNTKIRFSISCIVLVCAFQWSRKKQKINWKRDITTRKIFFNDETNSSCFSVFLVACKIVAIIWILVYSLFSHPTITKDRFSWLTFFKW